MSLYIWSTKIRVYSVIFLGTHCVCMNAEISRSEIFCFLYRNELYHLSYIWHFISYNCVLLSNIQSGAATRKGSLHIDRQNSEVSNYADDEDGNHKKYTRRGDIIFFEFLDFYFFFPNIQHNHKIVFLGFIF